MHAAPRKQGPLRVALWIIATLVALVLVAWGALTVAFPPAKVRTLVTARLSSALARELRFADASLGLWPPVRLTVRGPSLAEPGGFTAGTAFRAQSLLFDLDVPALFARRLVVRRLVLDRPELHLVLRPDGTTNLDGLVRPRAEGTPADGAGLSLAIRELTIRGGRALVDDLAAKRRVAFGLESRVAVEAEAGGERLATGGEAVVSGVAFGPLSAVRLADLDRSLAAIEWRVAYDGKFDARQRRLALGWLALRLGRAEIALSGVVDEPGPRPRVDLRARGTAVDLGPVLAALAAADAGAVRGIRGGGRLDFDLRVTGALGAGRQPTVAGTLAVADGEFRYPEAPAGVEGLALTARLAPDTVSIRDLRARVAGQPVRATLLVTRLADPWVRFSLKGDLDLAAVAPLVAPRDTRLGGRAAVDVAGTGRAKDPGGLALSGSARLAGVTVESPILPNRVEGVRADIRFAPARATVSGFVARAGRSSFALDATVERPLALFAAPGAGDAGTGPTTAPAAVVFQASSSYLDLAELLPVTPGPPVLPNATGEGSVTVAHLRNQRLDVRDVEARVRLEPGVLVVPEFSLRGYGGTALGHARFDLRDPAKPVYAVNTRVDSLDADAVLSAWTPVRGLVHGTLASTLDLSGTGLVPEDVRRTITAVGLAAVANGTLGPGPALEEVARYTRIPALKEVRFRDARLPFRVERGRVVSDPVVLNGPYGEWRLAGSTGFDGTLDYAVSVTLPPEVAERLNARSALAAGALADPEGRLLLDLRLTGLATAPRVSWDARAMRDRLAGRASQALADQRARMEATARAATEARLAAARDSTRAAMERARAAAADSLRRRGQDALQGFFGRLRDTTKRP